MSIATIGRGGVYGTRINHQKQNNQRELDVHGQCEYRRQDVSSRNETKSCNRHNDDSNKQHVLVISDQLLQVFDLTYWNFQTILRKVSVLHQLKGIHASNFASSDYQCALMKFHSQLTKSSSFWKATASR
jgi:hypothetical protein